MIQTRLKFYRPFIIYDILCLLYLAFFVYYDWSMNNYETLTETVWSITSGSSPWVIWGGCIASVSIFTGIIWGIDFWLTDDSDEIFFNKTYEDIVKLWNGFPNFWQLGLAFILSIGLLTVVSQEGWQIGLRNGLEFVGVIVWCLFIAITLLILPILLVDLFSKKLLAQILQALLKADKRLG